MDVPDVTVVVVYGVPKNMSQLYQVIIVFKASLYRILSICKQLWQSRVEIEDYSGCELLRKTHLKLRGFKRF